MAVDIANSGSPRLRSGEWALPLLVLTGAVVLGHAPLASLHLKSLWRHEHYQYFPFVIVAVAWLVWYRWRDAPSRSSSPIRWKSLPLAIAVVTMLLLLAAIVLVSPWLAFVSLNIGLAAGVVVLKRKRAVHYLWGIWFLLWLMIPPPLGLDMRLVKNLQSLSSRLSSAILDLFGVMHLMSGNVLQLPTKQFFVDEACSGIISAMSMLACAAIFAVWKNRSVAHLIVLVLSGVGWALALNVLRICLIAFAYHFFDIDLSTGLVHEFLGLLLFLLMFFALVSTDRLLMLMFAPIDSAELGESAQRNFFVRLWNRSKELKNNEANNIDATRSRSEESAVDSFRMPAAIVCAVVFVLLGAVQLIWLPSSNTAAAAQALEVALALDGQSMPREIGPWTYESFETIERESRSEYGRYSRSYIYRHSQKPGLTATVSLDFPYLGGWHDLCFCYRKSGWGIQERIVDSRPDAAGEWQFVVGDLEDESKRKARVCYAGFDAEGNLAKPAGEAVLFRPWFRIRRRLLHSIATQLYQVQVFASVNTLDDEETKQDLRELLVEARTRFRDLVVVDATK